MSAIASKQRPRMRHQEGVAAVELALLATLIFWFLASAILIAHSIMQATLVQRAANDAAHLIANYPQYLRSDPSVNLDAEIADLVNEELISGGIPASAITGSGSYCISCTAKAPPTSVGAFVSAAVLDPSSALPYLNTLTITASSSDRYAN